MPGPWKAWKTKSVSHSFHRPLKNLATKARFSHFHRPGAGRLGKWKTNSRFSTFPPAHATTTTRSPFPTKPKERKSAATRPPHSFRRSPFGRTETQFHAHPSIGKCYLCQ